MSTGHLDETVTLSQARQRIDDAGDLESFIAVVAELATTQIVDDIAEEDPAELARRYGRRGGR